jgi:hypothetical protein
MSGAFYGGKKLSRILSRPGFDARTRLMPLRVEGIFYVRPREVPQDPSVNGNHKKLPSQHHNVWMRQRGQNPNYRE